MPRSFSLPAERRSGRPFGRKLASPLPDELVLRGRVLGRSRPCWQQDPVLPRPDLGGQHPFAIGRQIFAIPVAKANGIGTVRLTNVDGAILTGAAQQLAQKQRLAIGRERLGCRTIEPCELSRLSLPGREAGASHSRRRASQSERDHRGARPEWPARCRRTRAGRAPPWRGTRRVPSMWKHRSHADLRRTTPRRLKGTTRHWSSLPIPRTTWFCFPNGRAPRCSAGRRARVSARPARPART